MPVSLKRMIEIFGEGGLSGLAKKTAIYIKRFFYFQYFKRNIKEYGRGKPINELIDFVLGGGGGIIAPWQDKKEITDLIEILSARKPKTILEIGTANGGTLFLFSRIAAPDAAIISVDLPHGKFGGGYPKWKIPLYKSFAIDRQEIQLIRASSHERATVDEVKRILGGRKIDFLFIDGDHTYDGAKTDYELYSPLVGSGGAVGFHDIVVHTKESGCDVYRFWNEIKKKYKHKEIVHDWDKKVGGIGLIFV